MAEGRQKVRVMVISDATGITAERVIQAVLVQFSGRVEPQLERVANVKSTARLARLLERARKRRAVVVYSLAAKGLRDWMLRESLRHDLIIIDILGPLISRMTKLFGVMPSFSPGLLGRIGEESIRLADAIDFTMRHDDGQNLSTLGKAEVIIIGASRTSKTPTSLYLSCNKGLRVANVPIVLGVEPPAKLFTLKRPRMVGFLIDADKLALIRRGRYGGEALPGYSDSAAIRDELAYSIEVFEKIKDIMIVDVTDRSIEEVAMLLA